MLGNSSNNNDDIVKRWIHVSKTHEPYVISGYNITLNDEIKNIVVAIYLDEMKNDVVSLYIIKTLLEKLSIYYNNAVKDLYEDYPELLKALEKLNNIDSAGLDILQ